MMGEAAGTACAVAHRERCALRDLSIETLQDELRLAGAILDHQDMPQRPADWPRFG